MTTTTPTPALTEMRAALLRLIHTTPHPEYARICTAADTALATSDPQAADQAAAALRSHSPGLTSHTQRARTCTSLRSTSPRRPVDRRGEAPGSELTDGIEVSGGSRGAIGGYLRR
ncbi:hypothetical protein [Streptomyces sp. NPDC001070]